MGKRYAEKLPVFCASIFLIAALLIGVRQELSFKQVRLPFQLMRPLAIPTPVQYAKEKALSSGLSLRSWGCIHKLWDNESRWNSKALNKSSGAYGIPQALPAVKMAVEGSDWQTNPFTQINWGFRYLKYHWANQPCVALAHQNRKGWY